MTITSKALKTFVSSDLDVRMLQTNVGEALGPVLKTELIDGRLITGLSVSTSAIAVNHGLNRKANGYIIVSSSAQATFSDNVPSADAASFNISASAPTTVSMWVF